MATKPQHVSEIYASQLEELCHGHPLWHPDGPSGADEIQIGDVGYIHNGQFIELFKARYETEDPQNAKNSKNGRIPSAHRALPKIACNNILTRTRYMEPDVYTTKSMKHKAVKPGIGG